MSDSLMNRRKLLGVALGATSSVALADGVSLGGLLSGADGERRVKEIIEKYFEEARGFDAVFASLHRSLLVGLKHHQDRKFFIEHLESKALQERLETYVMEEFVRSTNYFEVQGGRESQLRMTYS